MIYETGLNKKEIFSMSISEGNQVSKLTFGGYDLNLYAEPRSTLHWHSLVSGSRYWAMTMTSVFLSTVKFPTNVN